MSLKGFFGNWTPEMIEAHNRRIEESRRKFLERQKTPQMSLIDTGPSYSEQDKLLIDQYQKLKTVWKVGKVVGMSGQSVWEKLPKLGVLMHRDGFTQEEEEKISRFYLAGFKKGDLAKFCRENGLLKTSVARWARLSGLDTSYTREGNDEVCAKNSIRVKKWYAENEHPRGMLGKKHTKETSESISKQSKERWASMSDDQKFSHVQKALKAKLAKYGTLITHRPKTSWKAAWHTIGEKRHYFRSRWEVNYACYLEWQKKLGIILEWDYEPTVFWFEGVRKGTTNYTPDFRITLLDSNIEYHEVKGWMDARSKTKIKRMAEYHPDVVLIVRDSKWFKANARKLSSMVPGWIRGGQGT